MADATEIAAIIRRFGDFLVGASPYEPSPEDTNEDLLALHTLLAGFSAPKDQVPDRGVIGLLRDLCQDVDGALHKRLESDKVQMADFEVERTWASYSETWDNAGAISSLATAALMDETGEIPSEESTKAANTVVNAIAEAAGIRYWKVKTGDRFNVDLRKYRERGAQTSPAGVIVRTRKAPLPPSEKPADA